MNIQERKQMLVNAIRELENRICSLEYCEYDGVKSFEERKTEIAVLRQHWNTARSVLVMINEEELQSA